MIPTTTAIAAIAVAVSSAIYVLSGWRSRGAVPLALGLCLAAVLEVFDLLAVKYPGSLLYWKNFAVLAEAFIPAVWVWFGLTFSRESALWKRPSHLVLQGLSLLLPVLLIYVQPAGFFYSPDFETEGVLFLSTGAFSFYMAFLAFVVAALMSLEATLTSASHGTRWKIKFQAVGVGSYLAALILYYSHSLLYRTLDMRLVPVRSAILIVATALIVYSRAQRGVGARVAVSRQMAYRSLVLLAVGIYLVVLGLLGEGMKYFGEPFHRGALVFVGFASGLILVIALLSESVRRRARVFLHKNFYRQKYDYREQWLAFTNRLASARNREELCTSVLGGFVDILAMAWGELFLRDDAGGYAPAVAYEGDAATVIFPGDSPFIKDLAGREWVVNCTEEDLALSEAQIQYLREREALFVVPLLFDGVLHGFVVLGKPVDRRETYNYEDYDLMRTLARQASSAVLNLRLSEQLAQARELEAVGRVSTFIVHDLKNLVYTLSLVVDNAREYISEPEFQEDMLSSLENTVSRMKVLISRLKKVPEKEELLPRPENLLELARETAALVAGASIIVSGDPITAPVDRDEMQKVVLNLLVNAVEATEGQGRVALEVGNAGRPYLRVTDDGCGMSEDFVKNELFVPFHTTKKKGLGIGLYQCRQIVEGHGGRIDVETAPGQGAAFTVWL